MTTIFAKFVVSLHAACATSMRMIPMLRSAFRANKRLEDACLRAITYGHVSYKTIKNILSNNLDKISLPKKEEESPNLHHENIRGADYYH